MVSGLHTSGLAGLKVPGKLEAPGLQGSSFLWGQENELLLSGLCGTHLSTRPLTEPGALGTLLFPPNLG